MPLNATVVDEVKIIIGKIIEIDAESISFETSFQELGADSMMQLEIVVAIEKKFKIEIPETSLSSLVNLRAVVNAIEPLVRQ